MNDYQFIDYIKTPNDNLQLGIAVILVNDWIMRFRHMQKKDGSGQYFAPPSISETDLAGMKKYYEGFETDSRMKSTLLLNFIRDNVNKLNSRPNPNASPSAFDYPKAAPQPAKQEKDEELPF
jgi:hypothetical protein